MKNDLTKGSIPKNLFAIAVPSMLGFLCQTFYDIVDMFWIGKINGNALTAVTIFATIFWMVEVLNQIIGVSSIALISQSYGAKKMKRAQECVEQTIVFKGLVAVIAAIILLIFIRPLIGFFTQSEELIEMSLNYGYIRIFFLPLLFSSFSVNTALRCTGDSKTPMYIMLFSSILNIILDPILIFDKIPFIGLPGFGLGLFGAALATVISIAFSFFIGIGILLSGRSRIKISIKGLMRLIPDIDKKLITIGLPSGLEGVCRSLAGFLTLKIISKYQFSIDASSIESTSTTSESPAMAAFGIGMRIFGLIIMPLVGLKMGASTIAGQNLGCDNIKRAGKTAVTAAGFGFLIMIVVSVITIIFPEQIIMIFNKEPQVVEIGRQLLQITIPGFSLLAITFGLSSVFSGAGKNSPILVSGIVSKWLFQLPFMLICVFILKLDIIYVWISFVLVNFVEFIVIVFYYIKGDWKYNRV